MSPMLKPHVIKKLQILISVLILLVSLSFFLKKLAPTIFIGDSGELATAAILLGVPHPPGFPLFTLLGRCFASLPLGNLAWRLNLLSAYAGAATLALLYWLLLALRLRSLSAMLFALFAGSGYYFLEITVGTEVYSLHLLLLSLCFLLISLKLRYSLPLITLITGLGLGIHVTTIFLLPVIALFAYYNRQLTTKWLTGGIFLFLIGMSVYLCLPLRASNLPRYNWGYTANWSNFWAHVSNKKDADMFTQFQVKTMFDNGKKFYFFLIDTLTPGGILLLFLGIYFGIKKNIRWFILLSVFLLPFFLLYLPLPREPKAHLYAPVFLVIIIMLAPVFDSQVRFPYARIVQPLVIITILLINLWRFTSFTNERNNYTVYDHAHKFLLASAPISYLVAVGDITQYGILFLQAIEDRRPDVGFIEQMPDLYRLYPTLPLYPTRDQLNQRLAKYPIQLTWTSFTPPFPGLVRTSNGLLYVLGPEPPSLNFSRFTYRGFRQLDPQKEFWYQFMFVNNLHIQAAYYGQIGKSQKAISLLIEALEIGGRDPDVMLDLGKNYLKLGELGKAEETLGFVSRKRPGDLEVRNLLALIRKNKKKQN